MVLPLMVINKATLGDGSTIQIGTFPAWSSTTGFPLKVKCDSLWLDRFLSYHCKY